MSNSLSIAATGLDAQQRKLESISNDMANVNTPGYKRSRVEFSDLMYNTIKEPGAALGEGSQTPVGIQYGTGVKTGAVHKIFEPGNSEVTNNPFDIMIEGKGFIPVLTPSGETAYTRNGGFKLTSTGRLVLPSGAQMVPQITIPSNVLAVNISPEGEVKATLPDNSEAVIGNIQIAMFTNEQGLAAQGSSLYRTTAASGPAIMQQPGDNGCGKLMQGAMETSNVNVASSMVEMIKTQRAYEMGTKIMGVADQMLGATANIK